MSYAERKKKRIRHGRAKRNKVRPDTLGPKYQRDYGQAPFSPCLLFPRRLSTERSSRLRLGGRIGKSTRKKERKGRETSMKKEIEGKSTRHTDTMNAGTRTHATHTTPTTHMHTQRQGAAGNHTHKPVGRAGEQETTKNATERGVCLLGYKYSVHFVLVSYPPI